MQRVIIKIDDRKWYTNRAIISKSGYFRKMLDADPNLIKIRVEDRSARLFDDIIQYLRDDTYFLEHKHQGEVKFYDIDYKNINMIYTIPKPAIKAITGLWRSVTSTVMCAHPDKLEQLTKAAGEQITLLYVVNKVK